MFSSRFVRVVALCGALVNIEYSLARAAEMMEVVPHATPIPDVTPTSTPAKPAKPVINARAQSLLRQMAASYANLKSFSCTASLSGTSQVPKMRATIAWQKPNRFAVLMTNNDFTKRFVSNGQIFYSRNTLQSRQYRKQKMPANVRTVHDALQTAGASDLVLSGLDELLRQINSPKIGKSEVSSIQMARATSGTMNGVDVVVVKMAIGSSSGQVLFHMDQKSHLLRQVTISYDQQGTQISGTETYTNVRANPILPASTFAFPIRKGDTLRVAAAQPREQRQEQRFDPRLKIGARPLAFVAKDLNGNVVSPAKYRGKVLLLDFWATWCGPCVDELPVIKAAYDKYHAQGLEIVGISLDDDKKALTDFLQKNDMAWPQIFDSKGWKSAVSNTYGVRSIPFTVLIGRDGKIAALNLRGAALEPAIKAALARK